jgi:hypothetical protein
MEARRGSTDMCSCDLGLGVKSQSRAVIAGSYRSWPQSSVDGDRFRGRDTDFGIRRRNPSSRCPTPNAGTS